MFFLLPGFVLLCIHLAPAAKIVNVTLSTEDLVVSSPSRLLVPCRFYTDEPITNDHLLLEWAMTPENKEDCIPILRLFDTLLEPLQSQNKRAQVFVSLLPKGNCSLVIDPICVSDSGIYEARLSFDGVQYFPVPVVKIQVLEDKTSNVVDDCNPKDVAEVESDNVDNYDNETVSLVMNVQEKKLDGVNCKQLDPEILEIIQILQKLQKTRKFKLLLFGGILLEFALCLSFLSAVVLGIRYCLLGFKTYKNGSVKGNDEEVAIKKPDKAAAEMEGITTDGDDGKNVKKGNDMLPPPPPPPPPPEMSSPLEFKPFVDDLLPAHPSTSAE